MDWTDEFPAAVTVTDATGTVVAMNRRACETFAAEGGAALIGTQVMDSHPPRAREKVRELFENKALNVYTIEKNGQRKLVYQSPWFRNGHFAGFVELSLPVPSDIPHHRR
jgi:transcriptional regulator with PAS, ATPase and Fis domain